MERQAFCQHCKKTNTVYLTKKADSLNMRCSECTKAISTVKPPYSTLLFSSNDIAEAKEE